MPDNLEDYGMIYHLLRPDQCKSPREFVNTIKSVSYDPHTLSTFVDDNTLRRTAEEVNDLPPLDRDHWHDDIELTPVQKQIHEYLRTHRPHGWVMEARKALLDPRLVDPRILKRFDLLGKVTAKDSAKYARLDDLVNGETGPLAKGEKFVVFSSTLKEGVTRIAENIKDKYVNEGLESIIPTLKLEESLQNLLEASVKAKYGAEKYIGVIDGNVSMNEREDLANRFKTDKNLVGLICTTDTGGESLDFSNATHGYLLDEDFSPAPTEQAVARIQRRGQTKPVTIKMIRGANSFDQTVTDYVQGKSLAITIALDGHPPTKEEIDLLTKNAETKLGEMVTKRFGGFSVDAREYKDLDLTDIAIRISSPPVFSIDRKVEGNEFKSTKAQEIAQRIAQDPKCWFDPAFAQLYAETLPELAPYFLNRVRVLDLLGRAKRNEIAFPEKVLVTAAGPSIMWQSYQDLGALIQREGFTIPQVHDLDYSPAMLAFGKNPVKMIADMQKLPVGDKSYSLIDHGSLPLLNGPAEVQRSLIEANRALQDGGVLEMSVKNLYFMNGFHDALEQLGFKPLTKPHSSFSLSASANRKLGQELGTGVADAFKGKLEKSHFIVAKKVSEPLEVKHPENLWFLTQLGKPYIRIEAKESEKEEPMQMKEERKRGRWKRPKKQEHVPTLNKPYSINKDGTVDV
jgi:hypothetical protein